MLLIHSIILGYDIIIVPQDVSYLLSCHVLHPGWPETWTASETLEHLANFGHPVLLVQT